MGPDWQQRQRMEQQRREQMRRQQEQMRRQQEQKRRQMGAAYWQQRASESSPPPPDPAAGEGDAFAQVEREAARLRREWEAGRLTEAQFEGKLRGLMIQDEQGTWWMVGRESGGWHRHDGVTWVRADPPRRAAAGVVPQQVGTPTSPGVTMPAPAAEPRPQRFLGCLVLLMGLPLTAAIGYGLGVGVTEFLAWEVDTSWEVSNGGGLLCMGAVWLAGLIVTIVLTRRAWRRG
jgi:hypothetical protein